MSVAKFLEEQEGRILHSYLDTAGVWTIGVGSTMYQTGIRVKEGETITDTQADDLLAWEVTQKSNVINNLLNGVELNDRQMIAVVSFTYNLGIGALQQSTLLKVIKANPDDNTPIPVAGVDDYSVRNWMLKNNWPSANKITMCFMMWDKVKNPKTMVKEFSEAMMQRRIREANMYFS